MVRTKRLVGRARASGRRDSFRWNGAEFDSALHRCMAPRIRDVTDINHSESRQAGSNVYSVAAKRASEKDLQASIRRVTDSKVMSVFLDLVSAWVGVLNDRRQVLALNQSFLQTLGVDDAGDRLGLRLGEVLNCTNAAHAEGGCGDHAACGSCGMTKVAIAALDTRKLEERECILTVEKHGSRSNHDFVVSCVAFDVESEVLLLLCMREVSIEKRRVALERAFLHDFSNVLTGLAGATQLLRNEDEALHPQAIAQVYEATDTLIREVRVQRLLCTEDLRTCRLNTEEVWPRDILRRLETVFACHPVAIDQSLLVKWPNAEAPLNTDIGLLMRVLTNMLVNAFEAGGPGDRVLIRVESAADGATFSVWNRQPIPEEAALRVFQRYYSTKPGAGRGVGTFAMKLIGESLLQGVVSFATSETEGTTFRIQVPRRLQPAPKTQ